MKNIQVFKPFYRTEEIVDLVRQCCNEGWTGIGGKMTDFETAWKDYSGAQTCHFLNSATAGLHLAIMQLKMKYNWNGHDDWDTKDEIISTSITFISSNHAILYNGLKVVFADVDESGCIDPESLKERITSKTKAVLFVGLGGNIGKLHEIIKICKENNLKLIYDAAHSSGTKWVTTLKQVGCCRDGIDVSVFSGQAVKNLPVCDAGWICWNGDDAEEMDKQTRQLSWLGIDRSTDQRTQQKGSYKWHYNVVEVGYKYHGNAILGCFGLVGLKYLEKDNAYRRYLCDLYMHHLKYTNLKIITHSEECISSRHLFQILVEKRDETMLALNQYGIYPGVHYRSNINYPMYNYAKDTCSKAEYYSEHNISLPLHMHMTDSDVQYICDSLKNILKG